MGAIVLLQNIRQWLIKGSSNSDWDATPFTQKHAQCRRCWVGAEVQMLSHAKRQWADGLHRWAAFLDGTVTACKLSTGWQAAITKELVIGKMFCNFCRRKITDASTTGVHVWADPPRQPRLHLSGDLQPQEAILLHCVELCHWKKMEGLPKGDAGCLPVSPSSRHIGMSNMSPHIVWFYWLQGQKVVQVNLTDDAHNVHACNIAGQIHWEVPDVQLQDVICHMARECGSLHPLFQCK